MPSPATRRLSSTGPPCCSRQYGATPAARCWPSRIGCSAATTRSAAWCSASSTIGRAVWGAARDAERDNVIGRRDVSDLIAVCRSVHLTPAAYQFYRAVLLSFAERNGAPDQAHLRGLAGRFDLRLAATLPELPPKGMVQRDPWTGAIPGAHPFLVRPTANPRTPDW